MYGIIQGDFPQVAGGGERADGRYRMQEVRERGMRLVFLGAACVSVVAVVAICLFLLAKGLPAMAESGWKEFLLGSSWRPLEGRFGIFPMIVGSLCVTTGAMVVGVPLGLFCAVFMARFCPPGPYRLLKPAVDLMAGIPSIVYGFFGLMVIVPFIRQLVGGSGKGMLTAAILLGIMILPTIISVAEAAIRGVPTGYYEGSLALGATKERSVFFAELPAARRGIMAGIVLGLGRAMGETMAVVMICGNQSVLPQSIVSGVRTLTANIVLEMGYATDLHRNALIATAVVLFVFILIINILFSLMKRRAGV